MEILIAIFIVACLAVIYYWIFDAKQKEKQELIKEQINGLIESHTNQLKSEGVNVDTVYTYQDNAFKQLDWSKAVAFRLIVDVANRQIVICNDLSNPFSPQKIPFEKIINCEVLSKNGWLSRKGISRAVVGGVIGGGAGAIIGASSAQKSIAKIVIYTSDITTPSVTIDLYAKKNDTWDFDNERDAFAQQVCASIKAIIANTIITANNSINVNPFFLFFILTFLSTNYFYTLISSYYIFYTTSFIEQQKNTKET